MNWSHGVAFFFGGLLLANCAPHLIAGASGREFYTPFARPPFRGLSSPIVNTMWGLGNLAIAYLLLVVVGNLDLHRVPDVAIAAFGFGLGSLFVARSVTKLQGSRQIRQ